MDINGINIIITGGASGIGAETAIFLKQRGANIAILDQDLSAAREVADQVDGIAVNCNVIDEEEAKSALEIVKNNLGIPHVLINCAGIAPASRILGKKGVMPLADFEKVIAVNLIGSFNMLRLTAALMSTAKGIGPDEERGVIINTASIAAFEGQIGQAAYSASKGGVCSLTLPTARELARFHIRVMTIAPGLIKTPLLESLPEEVQVGLANQVPYPKRLGKPSEFALLAAHIIENPYLNGEIIRLDGSLRMQP